MLITLSPTPSSAEYAAAVWPGLQSTTDARYPLRSSEPYSDYRRSMKRLYDRIAKARLGTEPHQLIIAACGDSFAGIRMKYLIGAAAQPMYNLFGMMLGDANVNVGSTYTFSGGAALTAAGTKPSYWGKGQYWNVPQGGMVKCGIGGAAPQGNEFAVYAITDAGLGTASLELANSADNATYATLTFNASGSLGCKKLGFFAVSCAFSGGTGDTFKLTYCGQQTSSIVYSATGAVTMANLVSALEGLSVGGASLTGKVTVANPSGSTYQVFVKDAGVGVVPSRPSISFSRTTGTVACTFSTMTCWTKASAASGTVALVPQAKLVRRVVNGFARFGYTFSGTHMVDVVTVDPGIFATVWGDIDPDMVTLDQAAGQCQNQAAYEAYLSLWARACPTADKVHVGFVPTSTTSDATTLATIGWARPLAEAAGWVWFDSWSIVPGLASYSSLGSDWVGDGTHHGEAFNQYLASWLGRFFGVTDLAYAPIARDINTGAIAVAGTGATFTKAPGEQVAGLIQADQTFSADLVFKTQQSNRCFQFQSSAGTVHGQIGTYDGGGLQTFFKNPVHFGTATGAGIYTGAGSPENAVTAVVGSLYLRTDGGAGSTLYVKESGTSNTGWAAK